MIGLKELALIATLVFVLYGRSGVLKDPRFQKIRPWLSPVRRNARRPPPVGLARFVTGDRLFWLLTILAATALGAWIIAKALIVSRSA